jgi:hypothetical protein
MSIVTTMLGKLAFIGAVSTRVTSLESKLRQPNIPIVSSRLDRTWLSPSSPKEFKAKQYAQKAYLEAQARFLIAR